MVMTGFTGIVRRRLSSLTSLQQVYYQSRTVSKTNIMEFAFISKNGCTALLCYMCVTKFIH